MKACVIMCNDYPQIIIQNKQVAEEYIKRKRREVSVRDNANHWWMWEVEIVGEWEII